MKRITVIFLGCPKNFVDTESLLAVLKQAGYTFVTEPERSDIALLTTCAFIRSARRETYEKIRELIKLKEKGKLKRILVFGCLVQQEKEKLLRRFPAVDHFVGLDYLPKVPEIIESQRRIIYEKNPSFLSFPRYRQTISYAYLKISEGCANFCSYCRIPFLRGNYRSRPMPEILREAEAIAKTGIKEVILVSQDSTLYGIDLYHSPKLHILLKKLAKIKGIEWLRLLYTHPAHIYSELLAVIRNEEKVLKYIDLPLQHISDKILSLMGRGYLRRDVEKVIDQLQSIPNMVIRTTFIIGFPNESERDFQELVDFIRKRRFDHIGCFLYSREKSTPAYYLSPSLPYKVKKERRKILLECQKKISAEKLRSLIGSEMAVMVDGMVDKGKYHYFGRTYRDAPEIDGLVFISGEDLAMAQIYPMRITSATAYDLFAERIMAPRGFEPRSQG
uniref:Ribosomal protein uS12 methylthiotransferase RimO n=1 Tax=candidate division WOR-3 bacterium TaxID=2052148 RepID=A0A7C3UQ27_UNCW3